MSKFNDKKTSTKVQNFAGGLSYQQSKKLEFVSILLTSFLKDTFYSKENETVTRIKSLMADISDKKFLAKAAIFARTEFGMRSVSHLVARELARAEVTHDGWKRTFFNKVVHRVDDMSEILACYWSEGKKLVPHAMRKGFSDAFQRFDAYQLAKYKGEGKSVRLVDVVNVTHPKPTTALNDLMVGKLKPAETWEVGISASGGDAALKKEAWTKLIKERKIGYFALLRNLRNILEQAPDMVDAVCELLTDETLIRKSLVLPFRFQTALEAVEKVEYGNARGVMRALSRAVDISCKNVPKFNGSTLVVLDVSGSMSGKPMEIGSLFSAILIKSNDSDFMVFSDDAQYVNVNTDDSVLSIAKSLSFKSGGTNFHAIFQKANKKYDRVIILSDMQGWIGYNTPVAAYNEYKHKYEASPKIYSFDLAGYGTMQFPEENVYCLAGFSEKVFDILKALDEDKNAMLKKIESINL